MVCLLQNKSIFRQFILLFKEITTLSVEGFFMKNNFLGDDK